MIEDGQLVNQMIERGSGIVDTIPYHMRKAWIEWCLLSQRDDQFLRVGLNLMGTGPTVYVRQENFPDSDHQFP
jgi:hypothetical protein